MQRGYSEAAAERAQRSVKPRDCRKSAIRLSLERKGRSRVPQGANSPPVAPRRGELIGQYLRLDALGGAPLSLSEKRGQESPVNRSRRSFKEPRLEVASLNRPASSAQGEASRPLIWTFPHRNQEHQT